MVVIVDEGGRKCDERCYDAKRVGCRCVCGGKNHGLGLEHALEHQHDDVEGDLNDAYAQDVEEELEEMEEAAK